MCVYVWVVVGWCTESSTCIQVSLAITCLFVWAVVGWVTLHFFFLSVF